MTSPGNTNPPTLQAVLTGTGSLPARALFWHYPHYIEHPASVPCSVIRKGPWKLIETFDPGATELFNLTNDLSETINLASIESVNLGDFSARQEGAFWIEEENVAQLPGHSEARQALSPKLDQLLSQRINQEEDIGRASKD